MTWKDDEGSRTQSIEKAFPTMMGRRSFFLGALLVGRLLPIDAFAPSRLPTRNLFQLTAEDDTPATAEVTPEEPVADAAPTVQDLKSQLVEACKTEIESKIHSLVSELEAIETVDDMTLLNGGWELLYCSEDITRSSPFFVAFRQANAQADQIYEITDSIPAPLKEVGPATQEITPTGLVSRVKVATLGGQATSIMTTRCSIASTTGAETVLQVETTKPEESTILQKLGKLGEMLDTAAQPFPSGQVLERIAPGSSRVTLTTTFLDDTLRTSRYGNSNNLCVWRRTSFYANEL